MRRYNLTGSQNFYGQRDPKTYYNVPGSAVWTQLEFMCEKFNVAAMFIYEVQKGGGNFFVGTYSRKWKNIRDPQGKTHNNWNF